MIVKISPPTFQNYINSTFPVFGLLYKTDVCIPCPYPQTNILIVTTEMSHDHNNEKTHISRNNLIKYIEKYFSPNKSGFSI